MRASRRVQPPADLRAGPLAPRQRLEYTEADLGCYLCGSAVGMARWNGSSPVTPSVVSFAAVGASTWVPAVVTRIRCGRCGGGAYVEEVQSVRRSVEQVDWTADRPRRGRPPQWLVDFRRKQEAA